MCTETRNDDMAMSLCMPCPLSGGGVRMVFSSNSCYHRKQQSNSTQNLAKQDSWDIARECFTPLLNPRKHPTISATHTDESSEHLGFPSKEVLLV